MQISARTPACVAMTAMTIDHLSHGRLILGLGVSGPQVVEGWYGQPFPRPLERTREFVALVRAMLRREGPVTFHGRHYQLPLAGGSGLGKPLKLIGQPLRADVPIYLGAMGPKNIMLAREIADGWLPLFMSPYRMREAYGAAVTGLPPGFEVACPVQVVVGDDLAQCLFPVKTALAFYIGGMGHRTKNFSKEQVSRMGWAAAAERVQQLFIDGKRGEAIEAVPDALADEISLCGPPARIRDRLQAWRDTPVTSLVVMTRDPAVLRFLAEAAG
jgi:F420-dependent oxidoreductase-like protein